MSNFIAAQIIGVAAVCVSLLIFQVNKRERMLKISVLASLLYVAHFFLLGAYTGSAMNVIGGARSFTFMKVKPDKKHTWLLTLIIIVAMAATAATWQGPVSLLAMAGTIAGAFAMWHKKPKYIRRWALIAPPLWFAYNLLSGSYPGMLIEVIMLSSNLLGEYRYDFKHPVHSRRRLARPA